MFSLDREPKNKVVGALRDLVISHFLLGPSRDFFYNWVTG